MFENKDKHESYGMLGFYRTSSSKEKALFGSSIKHRDTIVLRLKKGSVSRSLNNDWYFGNETLFEVEMSATQFADLITSLNQSDGVPVTIRYTTDGNLHKCEEPPFVDRSSLHRTEFKEHLDDVYETSKRLISELEEKFATKKTFTKADKEEILNICRGISQNIGCNQDFQISQFDRHMERTTTEAKGEIEAFFQNKINSIAQAALVEHKDDILKLENPIDIQDE